MKFSAAQAVKITNEALEHHGEVGTVVGEDEDTGEIAVKLDSTGEIFQFNPADLGNL